MINLNTVQRVVVVSPYTTYYDVFCFMEDKLPKLKTLIPVHPGIVVNEARVEKDPFEDLDPLIRRLDAEYEANHNTLFLVDSSNRTAARLADMLSGPWKGFPLSEQTIVI